MDNCLPSGDVKAYERECNEGRYKRRHQKEYLKWDLQESKDLLGKNQLQLLKYPLACSVFPFVGICVTWW